MPRGKWLHALALACLLGAPLTACDVTSGRESSGQYVDDSTITAKIKAALLEDPQLKASQIKVETLRNVVQLSGFVSTRDEALKAERLAANVQGVQAVKNSLVVR